MSVKAAYGSWKSPISAADLAGSGHPVGGGVFAGDEVWWAEQRPSEAGRTAIRRFARPGDVGEARPGESQDAGEAGETVAVDVLPAPWNARSRVHEYGGGAWAVVQDARPTLVFAEFSDQRLYRLDPGAAEPVALTPAGHGFRFAELAVHGQLIWCVRETHSDGELVRDICTVPLDGAAADDPTSILSVVSGSRFLAFPRLSPDGSKLAWIAWDHPQMPWDGTELRVGAIGPDGSVAEPQALIGSATESVLQPEWIDDDSLYVISDRNGWWNLYELELRPESFDYEHSLRPRYELPAEIGGPLWTLGSRWYSVLADGRVLLTKTLGTSQLVLLDPETGTASDLAAELTSVALADVSPDGSSALVLGGSARLATGLYQLNLASGVATLCRAGVDDLPDPGYLPVARPMTFHGGPERGDREVHAFVYPPRNPGYQGLDDELPPYIAFVHGGPTGHVSELLSMTYAFFTSRGIGVIDINYGGSTGYGREYRERLRGQWGIVDVEDTVTAVLGLAEAGLADPRRLAIEGGSAGGWTVLAALTTSDAFACGASYFGVAELEKFRLETHDFESRYLDGLIGPWPEAEELYVSRAPLNNVENLSCPVLLLQGLDDPIVPPSQAERFKEALEAKHIPHAYLAYPGESHGFRKAENIISSREAELSFYGQVMGFVPADIPVLELSR
ncbi:prolyl oligopeptidase family serine peptidase [Saxibacter everestensis]|uniref:Prolyl oligopeptidase family serine peptidase n=1 Tax=Saxibacter everestensis TaxID=2909229 RepID=A0ABY8QVC3_9MICO|nr:prolyl oligopeptidase family serine peptidase [Brevibacteriaceae bacterium ZFBP1038]